MLRDNAFLVAAAALPVVVVIFFLISTLIPRWTVAPPQHDLLLSATTWDGAQRSVSVTFSVRDGQVYATATHTPDSSTMRTSLWVFDHATLALRKVPIDVPDLAPGAAPSTFPVAALAGQRVLTGTSSPDGYELRTGTRGSPGLVGEIFGMRRSAGSASLTKNGRVIPIDLPPPFEYRPPTFIGWIAQTGGS